MVFHLLHTLRPQFMHLRLAESQDVSIHILSDKLYQNCLSLCFKIIFVGVYRFTKCWCRECKWTYVKFPFIIRKILNSKVSETYLYFEEMKYYTGIFHITFTIERKVLNTLSENPKNKADFIEYVRLKIKRVYNFLWKHKTVKH